MTAAFRMSGGSKPCARTKPWNACRSKSSRNASSVRVRLDVRSEFAEAGLKLVPGTDLLALVAERSAEIRLQPLPCVQRRSAVEIRIAVDMQPEAVTDVIIDVHVILDTHRSQRFNEGIHQVDRYAGIVPRKRAINLVMNILHFLGIVEQSAVENCRRVV